MEIEAFIRVRRRVGLGLYLYSAFAKCVSCSSPWYPFLMTRLVQLAFFFGSTYEQSAAVTISACNFGNDQQGFL